MGRGWAVFGAVYIAPGDLYDSIMTTKQKKTRYNELFVDHGGTIELAPTVASMTNEDLTTFYGDFMSDFGGRLALATLDWAEYVAIKHAKSSAICGHQITINVSEQHDTTIRFLYSVLPLMTTELESRGIKMTPKTMNRKTL